MHTGILLIDQHFCLNIFFFFFFLLLSFRGREESLGMLRKLSQLSGHQLSSRPQGEANLHDERRQTHQSRLPGYDDRYGQLPEGVLHLPAGRLRHRDSSQQLPRGVFESAFLSAPVQAGRHVATVQQ